MTIAHNTPCKNNLVGKLGDVKPGSIIMLYRVEGDDVVYAAIGVIRHYPDKYHVVLTIQATYGYRLLGL